MWFLHSSDLLSTSPRIDSFNFTLHIVALCRQNALVVQSVLNHLPVWFTTPAMDEIVSDSFHTKLGKTRWIHFYS